MKEIARQLFVHALGESSVEKGFSRHVHCDHGVLRIAEGDVGTPVVVVNGIVDSLPLEQS